MMIFIVLGTNEKPVICSDLADLRHWQKKGLASDDPFNKFNKKLQFLTCEKNYFILLFPA
jgi:hypothetical protein